MKGGTVGRVSTMGLMNVGQGEGFADHSAIRGVVCG